MTAPDDSAQRAFAAAEAAGDPGPFPPWRLLAPAEQTAPVVFASPHSGRDYPPEFIAASRLNVVGLRRSEDAFMDEIFAAAPGYGAPLLCARFPRAYVDANREAFELDPAMFADPLPDYVNTQSPRIAAGLGTIARVVTDGEDIYHGPLRFEDALGCIEAMQEARCSERIGPAIIDSNRGARADRIADPSIFAWISMRPQLPAGHRVVAVHPLDAFGLNHPVGYIHAIVGNRRAAVSTGNFCPPDRLELR